MQISVNNIDHSENRQQVDANIFFSRYPDAPEPAVIETFNLDTISKEEALDILSGKKKVIYKRAVKFLDNIIVDQDVDKWLKKMEKAGEDMDLIYQYVTPIKCIFKLHLRDYRDTWFVDVNLSEAGVVVCRNDQLANHCMRFGKSHCKWLYEEACEFEEVKEVMRDLAKTDEDYADDYKHIEETRPAYYYFVVESIYDTNLVNAGAYNRDDLDQSIDEIIPFLDE